MALEGFGMGVLGQVRVGDRWSLRPGRNFLALVQGYLDRLLEVLLVQPASTKINLSDLWL
jgi:hypothetical protein